MERSRHECSQHNDLSGEIPLPPDSPAEVSHRHRRHVPSVVLVVAASACSRVDRDFCAVDHRLGAGDALRQPGTVQGVRTGTLYPEVYVPNRCRHASGRTVCDDDRRVAASLLADRAWAGARRAGVAAGRDIAEAPCASLTLTIPWPRLAIP